MGPTSLRLADLDRPLLATLIPEYLLCGQLIDRAGMPHAISAFGREGMRDVAIEEWMAASPVYSKRMQRALGFEQVMTVTSYEYNVVPDGAFDPPAEVKALLPR